MSDKEEDVFLDANSQDDETPRRSSRKRRSTAGGPVTTTSAKKAKQTKMPTQRSPGQTKSPPGRSRKAQAEAAASAPPGGEDFWAKMTTMLNGSETRLKAESNLVRQALESKLDGVTATVNNLKGRIESKESRLDSLENNITNLIDERVTAKMSSVCPRGSGSNLEQDDCDSVEEVVHKAWGSPKGPSYARVAGTASGPPGSRDVLVAKRSLIDPAKKREDDYWECRRAVRLRPVGEGREIEVASAYLRDNLKIDEVALSALGLDRARFERVPFGPKSKIKKELIIWFPTTEARDVVKGAARNLAALGQEYGVRHEIPNHLKTNMQALQTVSYDIKQRHPTARRNVVFDDGAMDLALDFCTREGEQWRRISSRQARQAKARRGKQGGDEREVGDEELDRILGRSKEEEDLDCGDE